MEKNEMNPNNELSLDQMESVSGGTGGSKTKLPDKEGCIVYQIKPGDTLISIAKEYGTNYKVLKQLNKNTISYAGDITDGFWIYVPIIRR